MYCEEDWGQPEGPRTKTLPKRVHLNADVALAAAALPPLRPTALAAGCASRQILLEAQISPCMRC